MSHEVFHDLAKYKIDSRNYERVSNPTPTETVSIPAVVNDPVSILRGSLSLAVNFDQSGLRSESFDMTRGPRVFKFSDGSYISPLVKNDGSIQFVSLISNQDSNNKFTYKFRSFEKLTLSKTSSLISIIGENSGMVGAIAPAWAIDSKGRDIPTHYEIDGQKLTQIVDTSDPSISYPIVADPWLGFDLIDHTSWVNTNSYSPTLSIFPSSWGKTVGAATTFPFGGPVLSLLDSLSVSSAWSEALSKTVRTGHPNPVTTSMFEQFECHFFYVTKDPRGKVSWNLDSKRPAAGLINQILKKCNVQ